MKSHSGPEKWPENVELVDHKTAEELLEKATLAAEEAAKLKKKDGDDEDGKKDSVSWTTTDTWTDVQETKDAPGGLHPDAVFETLKDGSTAFVIKPGFRLKLKLNDLLEGGDATKEERKKKDARAKKKAAKYAKSNPWGSMGKDFDAWDMKSSSKWFKSYINEYTITMDIKVGEELPRDGVGLFQTALIHAKENKRSGKTTLSRSDGECIVNQAGGVGMFGTFGDTTKARLEVGVWKRVVVAVKCVEGQNEKGEMRTWVNTEAGVVLKEESIVSNERFAIDPDNLFIFSSAQSSMMPGNISIRTIRVEQTFASESDVKSNRARDKVWMYHFS